MRCYDRATRRHAGPPMRGEMTGFVLLTPPKPKYGEPCNGCGLFCQACLCPIAIDLFPTADLNSACPALVWSGSRYLCAVVEVAESLGLDILTLGFGVGCDSRANERLT